MIQLHGAETNEFGAALNTSFLKAIRAKTAEQTRIAVTQYPEASALLLDPYVKGQHGGTGQVLDPQLWPDTDRKLVLAGGLSPDNVVEAIKRVNPFAVDLNSGVETAPGIKDVNKLTFALDALSSIKLTKTNNI